MNNGNVFKKKEYQESASVKKAYDALNSHNANKPGAYNSKWQGTVDDTINKILNREKFSYDLNGDALYQQYKDQYTTQGKLAMMNTMGQAAAMTGGYGSSYSQAAGQQAYQGYLQQLNEVVPQLYQMAYDRYNQEGQDMYSQYSMLSAQDQADYGKYRDTVADYYAERDYLTGVYNSERDFDYSKYQSDTNFDYNQFLDDRNYNYQAERDKVADAQWQANFDEALRQYNENFAYQKEMDANDIAYRDKVYADSMTQQKLDNDYRDKVYADSMAQQKLDNDYRDKAYADSMAQQKLDNDYRDKVYADSMAQQKLDNDYRDKVYADSMAQQKLDNDYRDKVYADSLEADEIAKQDKIDAENKAKNHDIAINLIAAGEEVPYEIQKIAGLSNTEISAFRKIYAAAGGATSDPTKVSDLTQMSTNLIEVFENYGPEAAAAIGMMYEQNGYVTHNELGIILSAIEGAEAEGNGAIDTSVEPIGNTAGEVVPDPEDEEEKKKNNSNGARAGGGAGKDAIRYTH